DQRRELSRHRQRARPRRVQRQSHRAAGCAEDRCTPVEPQPAAQRRRRDRHQAGAGDLRRRREVQPRRDDRTARCCRPLLPALARPRRSRGARAPDPCIRRVDRDVDESAGGPDLPRAAARGALQGDFMSAAIVSSRPRSVDFDVARIRRDFPILDQQVNGKPLVFLDSAASSQRPRTVIEAIDHYYEHDHANVHRGVYTLSQRATDAYEGARETIRGFINARSTREIIYVRGTTEAINLVAQSYARPKLRPGDEILISALEHHANIVPWQLVCEQTGAQLKVIPISQTGEVDFAAFERLIGPRTRLLALAHVSNALGTIVPVERFIARAKEHKVLVLIDGAQAVPHSVVDVQALDCDFYCFSG